MTLYLNDSSGQGLHLYMYEKPVTSAPVIPTTATLGTLTAIGSTLGGNQYQCNIRVDPTNAQRQAVTFKTGTAETDTAILWTTDGWSTQTSLSVSSSGDPDCVWDASGNLYYSVIDKGASNLTKVRKLSSPYTSFGSAVSLGVSQDHPNIQYDAVRDRLIVTGRTSSGGASYISYSDDHNSTWTVNSLGTTTWGSTPIQFGGCRAPNGDFVWHTLNSSTFDYLVSRTANFTSVSISSSIASWPSGGSYGFGNYSNIGSDGTNLYAPIGVLASGVVQPNVKISSDNGATWGSAVALGSMPSGYGASLLAVRADAQKIVVVIWGVDNTFATYRVYFTWSNDQGATWKSITELTNQSNTLSPPQPRYPGMDQYYFDMVGSTAYVAFPQATSNVMTTQYRTITFS